MTPRRTRAATTLPIPTCPVGQSVPEAVLGARFDRASNTYHWLPQPRR